MKVSRPFSVLIIVKGRKDHLENVVSGIEQSALQPSEIVIVHMNEEPYRLTSHVPIHQTALHSDEPLPLAAARNRAADLAHHEQLVFLDVDCIPTTHCFELLLTSNDAASITMVNPLYLSEPVEVVDPDALRARARPNPARSDVPFGKSDDYAQFWSLGFTLTKDTMRRIGGFDESFKGYGAEDTDFAYAARKQSVGMIFSEAEILHQPHPEYDPPLNWLKDIVLNAGVFWKKWGEWPMGSWLHGFEAGGYIRRHDDSIEIVRLPNENEINNALR